MIKEKAMATPGSGGAKVWQERDAKTYERADRKFDEVRIPGCEKETPYQFGTFYDVDNYGSEKRSYDGFEMLEEPKTNKELSNYFETEEELKNNSVSYGLDKSFDGKLVYRRGRLITVHEDKLTFGLLGYTDTNSEIHLTTRNDFDVPKGEVMAHECLHCSEPDRSELEIRYLTEAEFKPLDTASVQFSIYKKPVYTD
jgi:hypothetical protein